jgi:hypothetical protein
MQIKNTYPPKIKGPVSRRRLLSVLRWPFISAALISLTVNFIVGGLLWSIISVFGLYVIWTLFLSPDLVEYNRISQSIKAIVWSSILLALIDVFIVHGFSWFVIPIVCFSGLAVCIVLFFTNFETQKHNMLPLINFTFASIIGSSIALYFKHDIADWPYMVLLALSILFLFSLIVVLRQDFHKEMRKRFHIK